MRQNTATVYLSPEQEISGNEHLSFQGQGPAHATPQNAENGAAPEQSVLGSQFNHSPLPQQSTTQEAKKTARLLEKSRKSFSKEAAFEQLAGLIANMTESYSVVIFEANSSAKELRPFAVHSLSRDIREDITIGYGSGLVGWTAENKVRISVCPFERDASTLLYYSCDQALKSFIAVPILDVNDAEKLIGVIACDSKKSYAYSKLAEKVLLDCAEQASALFELFESVGTSKEHKQVERREEQLDEFLSQLRTCKDEQSLLTTLQKLPQALVESDAVVIAVSSEKGMGHGRFYPNEARNDVEHRLIQIVCKHKQLKTHGKRVHSLPLDDKQQRSFLSIPIRVLESEVGSLNLLSQAKAAFTSDTITLLETLAKEVGILLERLRLREHALAQQSNSALLAWPQFREKADQHLRDAGREKRNLELLRISFEGVGSVLETEVGLDVALASLQAVGRLIEQVAVPHALCGKIYPYEFLLLVEAKESAQLVARFQRLLHRMKFSDVTKEMLSTQLKLHELLTSRMRVSASEYPREAKVTSQLLQNCHIALNQQPANHPAVKE